jgi:hypothetical protein
MRAPHIRYFLNEAAEEEKKAEDTPDDSSIDNQIEQMLTKAERSAVQSGKKQANISMGESLKRRSLRFLVEAEGDEVPPLDPEAFSNEVARIVMNADTLIDLKGKILKRVDKFILKRYDQGTLDKVKQSLETNYGITADAPKSDLPPEPTLAVGASASAAGGA